LRAPSAARHICGFCKIQRLCRRGGDFDADPGPRRRDRCRADRLGIDVLILRAALCNLQIYKARRLRG
jgi:hypothetical protein